MAKNFKFTWNHIFRALTLSYGNGVRTTDVGRGGYRCENLVSLKGKAHYLHVQNVMDGFWLFLLSCNLFWKWKAVRFWTPAQFCMAWKWKCVFIPRVSPMSSCPHFRGHLEGWVLLPGSSSYPIHMRRQEWAGVSSGRHRQASFWILNVLWDSLPFLWSAL